MSAASCRLHGRGCGLRRSCRSGSSGGSEARSTCLACGGRRPPGRMSGRSPGLGGHVMLLDFDPQVTMLVAQPFWLLWRDGAGRSRRHAPDLFARMADGCGVVIDVRPDDRIEPRDAEAFDVTKDA